MSTRRERMPLELKGLLLVAVIVGLISLSIASYDKAFSDVVSIKLLAPRSGLQLNPNGDVRVRGALVGRIDSVTTKGDGAVITLDIDRAAAPAIASTSKAVILPTTLFGQKYVSLVPPSNPARPISNGDVIQEATTGGGVEVSTVLDHLEPVLTAVHPAQLSATLAAMAEGLDQRGYRLGDLLVNSQQVVGTLNKQLPVFQHDLQLFAATMSAYAAAAPDLLTVLSSSSVTAKTITDLQPQLSTLFSQLTTFSDLTTSILAQNLPALIAMNRDSRPVLATLARYSPEYPCLFNGLIQGQKDAAAAFVNGIFQVHIVLGDQANGYTSADRPRFGDLGRGPSCAGLPNPAQPTPAFTGARDGVGGS